MEPTCRSADRRTWTAGIRLGVRPGSWFARTECFGPVLGIIRADDLDHAIAIQNDSDFGLTAGLHALDPDEVERWLDRVDAGNVYVNRGTTGAIVQRQPFGGWKRSSVGPTAKAGGPNYVITLARWHDTGIEADTVTTAYQRWMSEIGHREHDPSALAAERNAHRYRALAGGVLIRYGSKVADRERRRNAGGVSCDRSVHRLVHVAGEPAAVLCARLERWHRPAPTPRRRPRHGPRHPPCCPCRGRFGRRRASRECSRDRATEVAARAVGDHDDASPRPTPPLAEVRLALLQERGDGFFVLGRCVGLLQQLDLAPLHVAGVGLVGVLGSSCLIHRSCGVGFSA